MLNNFYKLTFYRNRWLTGNTKNICEFYYDHEPNPQEILASFLGWWKGHSEYFYDRLINFVYNIRSIKINYADNSSDEASFKIEKIQFTTLRLESFLTDKLPQVRTVAKSLLNNA